MKLSEAKKGMRVRVTADITKSDKSCGATPEMYNMQETICTIKTVDSRYVYIKSKEHGSWWFHAHDIIPMASDEEIEKRETKKAKKLLFDPNNIVR